MFKPTPPHCEKRKAARINARLDPCFLFIFFINFNRMGAFGIFIIAKLIFVCLFVSTCEKVKNARSRKFALTFY
jgi:hypothetical protein